MDDKMMAFNDERYRSATELLKQELSSDPLPNALKRLWLQQWDAGFIRYELRDVFRYQFPDPGRQHPAFRAQYNPSRSLRQVGAGRQAPPPGRTLINGNCFLCPQNIAVSQNGVELGFLVELTTKRSYWAWANPFPVMPDHFTLAPAEHVPQASDKMRQTLEDLLELAWSLPGFLLFFNGNGAGASIPTHSHFHCFSRPSRDPFPLEMVANDVNPKVGPRFLERYPIACAHYLGEQRAEIAKCATNWMVEWVAECGEDVASANVIATRREGTAGLIDLYFVPRNRLFSHGPGFQGTVGGIEVLGELVFSSEDEKRRLDSGKVDYSYVHSVLAAVEPPRVREFFRRGLG
jgi:diadenosine tetraphosphate (Ap4A) HIT family hydrolase